MYVCIYIYIYICMYVYIYIYIYIYIYTKRHYALAFWAKLKVAAYFHVHTHTHTYTHTHMHTLMIITIWQCTIPRMLTSTCAAWTDPLSISMSCLLFGIKISRITRANPSKHVCICVCVCVCMYAWMYVCMYRSLVDLDQLSFIRYKNVIYSIQSYNESKRE